MIDIPPFEGFSFNYYRKLMAFALDNFNLKTFRTWDEKQPHIIQVSPPLLICHNIDVSLEKAIDLAVLENEMEIKTTYMIMTDSLLYNIDDVQSKINIRKIKKLGHDIGLHYGKNRIDLDMIETDCTLLEQISGSRVYSYSVHRPALIKLCMDCKPERGRFASHNASLLGNYFSDSRGIFRWDRFNKVWENRKDCLTQWLFHPIWWSNDSNSAQKNLGNHIKNELNQLSLKEVIPYLQSLFITLPGVFS